ncbi:MAG: hypothetical protein QOC60_411, partial [Frankiaceae bacterium]|nr:hypothetical protein [Frankiaceae bacterium]
MTAGLSSPAGAGRAAVVVLRTARWLPAGLLTAEAWDVLRASAVFAGSAEHPLVDILGAAGIGTTVLSGSPADVVGAMGATGPAVWL